MTDTEYQNLLAPAISMNEREAAEHYYNLAEQWYHLQNSKAFKAFSKHITRICKLLSSTDKKVRLDAVRALAFITACPRLHRHLFENDVLKLMVYSLASSPEAANCEAALVALNNLCTQSPRDQPHKFALVTKFCNDKQSLIIIFRYAHVEDTCLSIIANVMSVLAALCTERPNIQEQCIRAGIMERAFNVKTSHRDRIVRTNTDLFLQAMQLQQYYVDKFNDMYTLMCVNMGYPSHALCLGIWRLVVTKRFHDALKSNTLYTAVHKISVEDPTLEEDWPIIAKFIPNEKKEIPDADNNNNNNRKCKPMEEKKDHAMESPYSLIGNTSLKYCNKQQMMYIVNNICNKSDKLMQHQQLFSSWFEENSIDGPKFIKYIRKDFGKTIIEYGNNNKKLRGPSMMLWKELNEYDINELK